MNKSKCEISRKGVKKSVKTELCGMHSIHSKNKMKIHVVQFVYTEALIKGKIFVQSYMKYF